jgi:hypothetical protein
VPILGKEVSRLQKTAVPQKRKPQQKKPTKFEVLQDALKRGHMVWVPNGVGWHVQAFLQTLGPKKSNVKFLKGGYDVVKTSKIRLKSPD